MSYFKLPQINYIELSFFHFILSRNISIQINKNLSEYLNKIKEQIGEEDYNWNKYKKFTNPYEYIHTHVPNFKSSIAKKRPISRAYFKLIEIINQFNLFEKFENKSISTFHLAEGPGGFLQATYDLRNNINDTYYGMTLISDNDENVPNWNKGKFFLRNKSQIIIENGSTNTGNLINSENLDYCHKKYSQTCMFITGDGGIDYTQNYNNQELVSLKLILSEVAFAIACQKKGGHFVLKVFDLFTKMSLDILYLLSSIYEDVFIYKPNTSRYANSEKYIICKNYVLDTEKSNLYTEQFIKILKMVENSDDNSVFPKRLFNIGLPCKFKTSVEEINAVFGQQQLECIVETLNLIRLPNEKKKKSLIKTNVKKCLEWCDINNIEHNNITPSENIFLNSK